MSREAPAAPAAPAAPPAAPAAPAAPTTETLDQQLAELFGTPGDKTKPGDKPTDKPVVDPAAAAGTEDPLEKLLGDIKEDEAPKEEKPAEPQLTTDQQAVLKVIPTQEVAQQLFGVVQNYQNFTQAFESGEFEKVEAMFDQWDSTVYENFLEYLYDKHMVKGDWANRFIAEAEGRGTEHKGHKALEAKLTALERKLQAKEQQQQEGTTKAQQQAENSRIALAYENYVTGLFDKIEFNKADRKWVMQDLNSRVGSDPKIMQAVRSGNLSALNAHFKSAVREYVNRDKQVAAETDKKIDEQNKHKTPVAGGTGTQVEGALPADVKQVKKGQEENWMMGQLNNLFSKVGKKK